MNPLEFYRYIIWPTLDDMKLGGDAACQLLLGTALVESNLEHLVQTGSGPARGVYQMEPATHDDIWENYLKHRPEHVMVMERYLARRPPNASQLVWNLGYATCMVRWHYRRVRPPLPAPGDIEAMAWYWKRWYNTFSPGETKKYQLKQVARFVGRFPKELI